MPPMAADARHPARAIHSVHCCADACTQTVRGGEPPRHNDHATAPAPYALSSVAARNRASGCSHKRTRAPQMHGASRCTQCESTKIETAFSHEIRSNDRPAWSIDPKKLSVFLCLRSCRKSELYE